MTRRRYRSFAEYPDYRIRLLAVARSGLDVAAIGRTTGSHVGPHHKAHEPAVRIAGVEAGRIAEWRILTGKGPPRLPGDGYLYSTVTLLARLRG
jgi:hypothetical protein